MLIFKALIPPYSPELNPVEQLWQQIKQRFLSNTTFQNYDDIIERSCQAWNEILSENGFFLFWQKLGLFFVKYLRFFAVLDKKQFC
jgi:transposase